MYRNSLLRTLFVTSLFVAVLALTGVAQEQLNSGRDSTLTPEQRTANYFESIRKSPPKQLAFLLKMPKGGDLHSHLSGAVYAERYISWSAEQGLCLNTTTMVLSSPDPAIPNCGEKVGAQMPQCRADSVQVDIKCALQDGVLYRRIIDSWSTRNWEYSGENGHDKFFDTFGKFGRATWGKNGAMLADTVSRAARGRVSYLELMLTPDGGRSSGIGRQVGWDGDFEGTLKRLKSNNIDAAAEAAITELQNAEAEKDKILKCGTKEADPGCRVTIRYISQVSRGADLGAVYAQMVTGFALANNPNSKVVALNLVQAEDGLQARENFSLHMKMLGYLKPMYPQAHITLHAGELAPGLVPPEDMTFHIRESVMIGQAERIGHGVDIMHEDDPYDLMRELARRNVMIEICLTSNAVILGVSRENHPLRTYMEFGVPVALATDDEGVSRSEISMEFLRGANEQGLGYLELKMMARNSLHYAFVPGESIWTDMRPLSIVPRCATDAQRKEAASESCRSFLAGSEKARLQWELEKDLTEFEKSF